MDEIYSQQPPATPGEQHPTPQLAFVEPKLTAHGDLKQVTGEGFFGGFTP
jgi:hypothetical protein